LSAAKNLVLYRDVSSFLWDSVADRKVVLWVLMDEILRCAQNDKAGAWILMSGTDIIEMTSR
ncbi:MAG: hypothetical protein QOH93_138, partial [Chloroflexia bacterium]|nr:hypothetical protein [Chloroflexia bacterium]